MSEPNVNRVRHDPKVGQHEGAASLLILFFYSLLLHVPILKSFIL